MSMISNKILYNVFVFLWALFGFIVITYAVVNSVLDKSYKTFSAINVITIALPWVVTLLYLAGSIKYRVSLNRSLKAQ